MASRPRIPPLAPEERDAQTVELLHTNVGTELADLNIFATLVRHPRVFKRWARFGTAMLFGSLPDRDRELLILRTAHHVACEYEWGHHHEIAQVRGGLTVEEIEAVRTGPSWPGWSAWDATMLRAADELHEDARIGDSTWSALAERHDDRLLIEVPMVVPRHRARGGLPVISVADDHEFRDATSWLRFVRGIDPEADPSGSSWHSCSSERVSGAGWLGDRRVGCGPHRR